jgi:hypothetical protein
MTWIEAHRAPDQVDKSDTRFVAVVVLSILVGQAIAA